MMENKVRNAILREFWKLPYKYKPEINYDWQYKSIRLMREISAVVGMGNWIQCWSLPQVTPC